MFGNAEKHPQDENTKFNPRSAYGVSKIAGYYLTKNYREAYKLYACSGILFNHESPRRNTNFISRKISSNLAMILRKRLKKINLGNINAKRDWGHAKITSLQCGKCYRLKNLKISLLAQEKCTA